MHPIVLPLSIVAAGIAAIAAKRGATPEEIAAFKREMVTTRPAWNGAETQYFKPEVGAAIMRDLGRYAVAEEVTDNNTLVYRIVPQAQDCDASAAQAAMAAQAMGLAVLGSHSLIEGKKSESRYLVCCAPSQIELANTRGQLAVLLDFLTTPQHAPAPVPPAPLVVTAESVTLAQQMLDEAAQNPQRLRDAAAALISKAEEAEKARANVAAPEPVATAPRVAAEEAPAEVPGEVVAAPLDPSSILVEVAAEVQQEAAAHLNGAAHHAPFAAPESNGAEAVA